MAPTRKSFITSFSLSSTGVPAAKKVNSFFIRSPFFWLLPSLCSLSMLRYSFYLNSIRKTKVLHCSGPLLGKPFPRESVSPAVLRAEWPSVSSASFATAPCPGQSLSTSLGVFAWLSKPFGERVFFQLICARCDTSTFQGAFSGAFHSGMWAGALMVRNTSARQAASASLRVCPSLSRENSSFTVFYTSLAFSTSCSTA